MFEVADLPASERVDQDVSLVLGGHFIGLAVPFENALLDAVHFLNERGLEMQSRVGDRSADRFAKLGDDDLFGFLDGVGGAEEQNGRDERDDDGDDGFDGIHRVLLSVSGVN